jgi:23S rRNA (guanosine2251-2'-O)-methyltransferase
MRKLRNEELNRMDVSRFRESEKTPLVILLDNVRSLHNIGSVFRTADAFLVEAIYLCGITACPPHKDIQKTALGATETVEWKYFQHTVDAVKQLQEKGYRVYAAEQAEGSIFLQDFVLSPGRGLAVVLGHEVDGVSQEVIHACDGCIEVPQYGSKHSLNIAVCAGIVVWELFMKLRGPQ